MKNAYGRVVDQYVAAGWQGVLPLPPKRKNSVPAGYSGREGKWPTDEERAAWGVDPGRGNVALRPPADIIGIDVDHYVKDGIRKTGMTTLRQLEAKWGPLPKTFTSGARDPGQGGIRWYRVPSGTNFHGVAGKDIEIITWYHRPAVVWPSEHPDTGAVYRWRGKNSKVMDSVPSVTDIPDLPHAWVEGLQRNGTDHTAADLSDDEVGAWLGAMAVGDPCKAVSAELEHTLSSLDGSVGARHDAMLAGTWALLGLGAKGHAGVFAALVEIRSVFVAAVTTEGRDGGYEYDRAVADGVRKRASVHTAPAMSCGCSLPVVNLGGPVDGLPDAIVALPRIPGVYNRRGRLVLINSEGTLPEIIEAKSATVVNRFSKHARVFDFAGALTTLPRGHADAVLEDTVFSGVPKIDRVIALPSFRKDGTLITEPGYDPTTGLFLAEHNVRIDMTLDEAKDILFGQVLHDFPFKDEASKANAVALVLTQPLRPYLGEVVVPFGLITAGGQGEGKTNLATVISRAAGGTGITTIDPGYEEERGKIISARLLASDPVIILDNIKNGESINSPKLSGVVTSYWQTIRPFGTLNDVLVANDRVWLLTGNNVVVGEDNTSRTVLVVLDSGRPDPDKRTDFVIPDLGWWLATEGDLLVAAVLTILRGWFEAGAPKIHTPKRNFTGWASAMAGILDWLGIPGFLSNEDQIEDVDTEYQEWAELLASWDSVRGDAPGTVKEIMSSLGSVSEDSDGPLPQLVRLTGGRSTAQAVGIAFRAHRDRFYGGRRIVEAGRDRNKSMLWRIERTEDALPAPEISAPAPVIPLQRNGSHDREVPDNPNKPRIQPNEVW